MGKSVSPAAQQAGEAIVPRAAILSLAEKELVVLRSGETVIDVAGQETPASFAATNLPRIFRKKSAL